MDFVKYILALVVLFVDSDAGGHQESHHDHVKLHVPEFIHHDHHTKVITIHHHHHKPKNEHHHHHHHHHKPIIPHGPPPAPFHAHHHIKTSTRTVSKGHTHLNQKSHGGPGHRFVGNRGHRGHENKHHNTPVNYDPPTVNYEPPMVNYAPPPITYSASPAVANNYASFLPSVSTLSTPHVQGVVHTVKQVKVFDSLPGALPGSIGNSGPGGLKGYEVTEQGDEGEDDIFTSVNSLSQSYPGTYGFVRNAAAEQGNDVFSDIPQLNTIQSQNNNPFHGAQPQPTYSNAEDFKIQNYSPSRPALPSVQPSPFSDPSGFDNSDYSVIGDDVSGNSLVSFADGIQEDTPVIFSREAGLQHAINTEGIETVSY